MNKFLVTIVYFLVYHITKKNRVDLFERILATDAEYAYKYAKYYLQKRFILAEPVIQNSDWSTTYLKLEVYWRIKEYTLIPQDYKHVTDSPEFEAEDIANLGYEYIGASKYHITSSDIELLDTLICEKIVIVLKKFHDYNKGDIIFVHRMGGPYNNCETNFVVFEITKTQHNLIKDGYVLVSLVRKF